MKKPGRPLKYGHLLAKLVDDELYCPAKIVDFWLESGWLHFAGSTDTKAKRIKIRHTLARYSANHHFPFGGEGFVIMPGQAPIRAWYGATWKRGLPEAAEQKDHPVSTTGNSSE